MNQTDYLDRVVNRIADETVNIDDEYISTPFYTPLPVNPFSHQLAQTYPFTSLYYFFERYVKEEYGLTHGEVKYAWEKYKDIIITL